MLGWTILAGIVGLVLVVAMTPLHIHIRYGRVGENDLLTVEVTAWFRLIRFRYEIPAFRLTLDDANPRLVARVKGDRRPAGKEKIDWERLRKLYTQYRRFLGRFVDVKPVAKQMMRHVRCTALEWHSVLGTGDAADTGALTGAAWGVKTAVVGALSHHIALHTVPRLSVQPLWNDVRITTRFRCILHFRIGHAMVAGVRLLLLRLKGSERNWQSTPSKA